MNPQSEVTKRPFFKGVFSIPFVAAVLLLVSYGSIVVAQQPVPGFQAFMQSSGQWLLDQQRINGSFPEGVPDLGNTFPSVQSPSALGLLSSWFATEDQEFLDRAVDAADYLIANFEIFPGTTDPKIRTFDPLFFQRLSAVTGDPTYADFIDDNFWTLLAAGTYGEDSDWDIDDYVQSELARRGNSAIAAWDLALIAAAAEEAGITTFRAALAAGAAEALETPDASYTLGSDGFNLLGLAGAVWLEAVTGESVTPTSGPFAGSPLVDQLLDFQAAEGGFLQSDLALSTPIDETQTVSQITAFAVVALDALDPDAYASQIAAGLSALINVFPTPGGRISYFHPEADLATIEDPKPFVYAHAYIVYSVNESGEEPPPPMAVPVFSAWSLTLLLLMMLSVGWVALVARK